MFPISYHGNHAGNIIAAYQCIYLKLSFLSVFLSNFEWESLFIELLSVVYYLQILMSLEPVGSSHVSDS